MYKPNLRLLSVLLVLLLLLSTGAALTQELTPDAPTVDSAPPVYQEPPYGLEREKGDRASIAAYRSTVTERERQALLEEAVRWYSEALANPSDTLVSEDPAMRMDAWASVHNSRGIAYYRLGQHHLAVADYNSALELDPNPFYRKNRGLAYEALGDLEKALADFKFYVDWVAHIAGWEEEHAYFVQKVKELQQEVKVEVQTETNQTIAITSTPEGGDIVPLWWAWANYYGRSKNHNHTYPYPGGTTTPNLPGWQCELLYPSGTKIENAVWFQLPGMTSSRTAHIYWPDAGSWGQTNWDHQYATGAPYSWDPYGSYNYFLQVPNTSVCTLYANPAQYHKIHAYAWYD